MKQLHYFIFILFTTFLSAQQIEKVDFKTAKATININPSDRVVEGSISYSLTIIQNVDSVFIDARNMEFQRVSLDNKSIDFYNDGSKLWISDTFTSGSDHKIDIQFKAEPRKAMYFIGWELPNAKKQVWTQGQGKYTSNWLPSFDDMNEKVTFDLSVSFQKGYTVISNGKLLKTEDKGDHTIWHYDMEIPMSSYLLAIAVGRYNKKRIHTSSGTPVELYYYPEDSLKVGPTYQYTSTIFDFFESELGDYPWQNYKQVPVKDFLYAGMENTTATIFSDAYIIDNTGITDKDYINVNAHELAHQWFGNLVTEKSGEHHWLQEGFATYYALLAEREIFGDDYFYWKLYKTYKQLKSRSQEGKGESLSDPKASSLTFYEKGAWALVILRELTGDKAFKKSIKKYLETYKINNATIDDFIKTATAEANKNLKDYTDRWIYSKKFQEKEALDYLRKNNLFIRKMLAVENSIEKYLQNPDAFKELISSDEFYPLKQEVLYRITNKKTPKALELYKYAFESKDIKSRQAIALSLDTIPLELKGQYESLLNDKSYVTNENALLKLWLNFPENRNQYLDETKDIIGFNDRSLRILWLALALATPEYNSKNTPVFYNELSAYTSAAYHFEVRQYAFQFLFQLQAFTDKNLIDLVQATQHPAWQFSKFSKQILNKLLEETVYKKRFERILSELNDKEQKYIKEQLNN